MYSIINVSKTIIVFFCLIFASELYADTKKYVLDPHHTTVTWSVDHFGYTKITGKLLANGTLMLDKSKPQDAKITVTIDMDSMTTSILKFTKKLSGKDFFNFAKYPTATFVSHKIELTGKDSAKIYGTVTIHNISKPLVLNAKLNKMGIHEYRKKQVVGFSATTTLKRTDFDLGAYAPGVSDEVTINIELEALVGFVPEKN